MNERNYVSEFDSADQEKGKKITITTFFDEEELRDLMCKIAGATGFAVALADYRGDECTQFINYCDFCKIAREGSDPICTAANATNAFGIAQASVTEKPFIYFCPYGLLMIAIPIIVDEQYLGGFIGGQVRCDDAPENTVHLKNILSYDKDFLQKALLKQKFEEIPVVPYQKFVDTSELIALVIKQLCEKKVTFALEADNNQNRQKLLEERQKRMDAEKRLNDYKITVLRSQLKPYCILSTLTAISNLAIIENAMKTNELITMFARFLSDSFRKKEETSTMEEEMALIDSYLQIQKACMGERFSYEISVSEDIKLQPIPILLIFPFVENSVYYGISCKKGKGKIKISAKYENNDVMVSIEDDGLGVRKPELDKIITELEGFSINTGIEIARHRMETYFGKKYELKMESKEGEGTKCTICYPRFYEKGVV